MISVAIPCYHSAKTIRLVVENARRVIMEYGESYQFVLVNDGSPDNTIDIITQLCEEDSNIIGVDLARNFGQHSARMAALPYLTGDYVVYMDDDGQHPPEGIIDLLEKIKEGYDIVYANFEHKEHSLFKRIGSKFYVLTMNWITDKPRNIKTSSYSIMKLFIVKALLEYKSPFPNWSAYIMQITTNVTNVKLPHRARTEGVSGYNFRKMFKLWMANLTSFSAKPIHIFSGIGFLMAISGFIYGLILIIRKLVHPNIIVGYTSNTSILLIVGGMIMLMQGLLGEYVGRIFMTINNKPQYIIKETIHYELECRTIQDGSKRQAKAELAER